LPEVVGERVGGGGDDLADLDLDSAVAVDGLHEVLIDQPVCASIQRLAASAAKTIAQVGSYGVALAVVNRGLGDLLAIPRSVRRDQSSL